MKKGVIVRHLLLPNHVKNAKKVVKYVYETYGDSVYLSLMNQYTPLPGTEACPKLGRRVTKREYERLLSYTISLGVEKAFIQEGRQQKKALFRPLTVRGLHKKQMSVRRKHVLNFVRNCGILLHMYITHSW